MHFLRPLHALPTANGSDEADGRTTGRPGKSCCRASSRYSAPTGISSCRTMWPSAQITNFCEGPQMARVPHCWWGGSTRERWSATRSCRVVFVPPNP